MNLCKNDAADIVGIEQDLKFLNEFYTEARYADDFHIFGKQEAEEAFERARKVKDFVFDKIKPME